MSRTILVTAIGSFSAAVVVRKYKEEGFRVIGCDIYPAEWIGFIKRPWRRILKSLELF